MTAFKQFKQRLGSRKLATNLLQASGVLYAAGLAIHSVAEQFKTTNRFVGRLNGETFGKAATTALTFSAAHVVTASKFGAILVQITPTGTISTKVVGSPQAYTTAAAALAALPAADAGNVAMGYIAIAAKAATWTANTDDLTNGSDLTTASFNDYPAMTFTS
jgi:hypothetical protein